MVTKVEEGRYSDKNVYGDNRVKNDWARGGGMNIPRMRRPEDQSPTAGLMMEVWASVASWFLKPDGSNLLSTTCSSNSSNVTTNSSSSNANKNHCRISSDIPLTFGPTICTAIRCTVAGCNCECFTPGKLHIRYCESCSHGWVPHALDKLGYRNIFGQTPVEPVQSNVVFDIASLVLYGCQALPIRLKILLDRLFSVLTKEDVTQILRGFGWSHEDYVRGYILQEAHGMVLDRWNICSPEDEPLVLQQFLRFGETRAITQQLMLHGLGDLRHLPRIDADIKKMVEKGVSKSGSPKIEDVSRSKTLLNVPPNPAYKMRGSSSSSPTNTSAPLLPPPPPISSKFPPLLPPPPPPPHAVVHPLSPQPKSTPLNFVKLPQTGLTCTPVTTSNGPVGSPPTGSANSAVNMSPLNKLQNMQPFDFRKIATGIFPSSKPGPERRRHSEVSDASQTGLNLSVTSPSTLIPHPPLPVPPQSVTSSYSNSTGCKSPVTDFPMSKGSSEFGSEDGDDDDEESAQNVLNLSKDAVTHNPRVSKQRHGHSRKTSTPMKRQWGSSNLPLNLGTQLINPTTGKKRVQCNVCLKTFCDKGALKIHFSAVHLREMHKCTVEGCNMMFSSRRSRNRHSANPNPKLHSPHLRRKISPHDGRSAQAHPILIPPLQAGLNPLSFGPFPLLTPPDLRHQLSGLDLKQGFDFNMKDSKFEMSSDNNDEYMDDDYEDGIVVDGAGVDDDENDSETNSGGKAESTKSKQTKMSESDMEDGVSNTDSNESMTLSDHQPTKEEFRSKSIRKRKSQKPTRCTRPILTDDEPMSDEYSDDMMFSNSNNAVEVPKLNQEKEWDLSKPADKSNVEEPVRESQTSDSEAKSPVNNVEEKKQNEGDQCLNLSCNTRQTEEVQEAEENDERKFTSSQAKDESVEERISPHKSEGQEDKNENGESEPINFAMDMEASSPAGTHESCGSSISCDSDENGEYGHFEDGTFIPSGDVPLDKDNPRKCTACGKVFQNHFGVKTHFQNVHLKLMHKCVVEGCNAAFPSKRSRDRHSANLNLHRKLLSTSDTSVPSFLPDSPSFNTSSNANLQNEFFSRLYNENQNMPLNCPMTAASPKATNGELITSHPSLMILPLGAPPFPGLNPYPGAHLPVLNGKSDGCGASPSKSPRLYVYNVEEDIPTPDQDNIYRCRFCSKPFSELVSLKDHYERNHLSEMHRCKVPGCFQVFSSRTKRNIHSENRLLHAKEIPTS